MNPFIKSARFRLLLLVILAVVPALGLVTFSDREIRQLSAAKARIEAQRLARLTADSYLDLLASGQELLTGLAQLGQVTGHDSPGCAALFASMLKEFPEYANLTAADLDGNVFCSGKPFPDETTISGQAYFQRVIVTRQFTTSAFQIDPATHQSTVVLAHPAFGASGQMQAVVTATLNLSVLQQVDSLAQLSEQSVFFIIDNHGTVVTSDPDLQPWVGKTLPETGIVETILDQKAEGATEASGLDGIRRLYAYLPLRSGTAGNAYIAVGFPVTQIYGESDRLLTRDLIALGCVAALALAAAWVLGDVLILRQVKVLLDAARRWTAGDLDARTNVNEGPTEFVRLASAFDSMAEALKERETHIRLAEREVAENATRIKLQSALIEQREQERLKIARDLHDGPVQELTGITLVLQGLILDESSPETAEQLEAIKSTLQEQIRELRTSAGELRPPTLSKFGLGKAIRSHLDNFQEKNPGISARFEAAQEGETLDEGTRLALFRICQEALNNAVKHAQATEVLIRLAVTQSQITLEIQDNGRGFAVPTDWIELARQGHLGLVGMRERAEAVGGQLEILSRPGKGTTIRVSVPLTGSSQILS